MSRFHVARYMHTPASTAFFPSTLFTGDVSELDSAFSPRRFLPFLSIKPSSTITVI